MEIYGDRDSFLTDEYGGSCYACHYVLPRLVDSAPGYFTEGYVTCQHCREKVDLWRVVSRQADFFDAAPAWVSWTDGTGTFDRAEYPCCSPFWISQPEF
jgi:hypothetical protein